MMAYALTGFAVLHMLTSAWKSRGLWLSCAYAVVLVFGWPILAMVVLGLADAIFGFRERYLQRTAAADPRILKSLRQLNLNPTTSEGELIWKSFCWNASPSSARWANSSASRTDLPATSCSKRGKALRATADNRAKFEGMKAELEARNLQAKGEATKVAEKIDGRNVVVLRQASETGQLFGSVNVRDLIASFEADGVSISRSQVMLDAPIKTIGKHKIAIAVHPEVEVSVSVTVARSADEAERINRGEDISSRQEDQDAAAEALAAAGEFFDPEARRDEEPQETRLPTSNAAFSPGAN